MLDAAPRPPAAPQDIVPRFNERMVLSLASCPNCIMMDDELNVLPTSRCAARVLVLVLMCWYKCRLMLLGQAPRGEAD